mmetsp:Transcript_51979/g.161670  ORF Transcript_51979/g.161670 Transcript_51979/m.161670 type:complete len:208 (-) Transcript_51979:322-945(-)
MSDTRLLPSQLLLLCFTYLACHARTPPSPSFSVPCPCARLRGGVDARRQLLVGRPSASRESERARRVLDGMRSLTLSEMLGRLDACLLARNGSETSILDLVDAQVPHELMQQLILGEESPDVRLLHGIVTDNRTRVEEALSQGADPDRRLVESNDDTLLHLAVKQFSTVLALQEESVVTCRAGVRRLPAGSWCSDRRAERAGEDSAA